MDVEREFREIVFRSIIKLKSIIRRKIVTEERQSSAPTKIVFKTSKSLP